MLYMEDLATKMAGLRTGKIVMLRDLSNDQAESLQRTNPDLVMKFGNFTRSSSAYGMDMRKPPFDDVRVRSAMQLAIDIETLNNALYGGLGITTPSGIVGKNVFGFYVPFEEWPRQLKADYGYDPSRAEKLLDEAGYPRGADGVRFKTTLHYVGMADADLEYTQAAVDYWAQIGVDVEINMREIGAWVAMIHGRTWEGMTWNEMGQSENALMYVRTHGHSTGNWNFSGVEDPEVDAMVEAAENAPTREEMTRIVKEIDMRSIEEHWGVWGPQGSVWHFWQPWLGGYNGEMTMGGGQTYTMFSRLWVEQELKEAMGH